MNLKSGDIIEWRGKMVKITDLAEFDDLMIVADEYGKRTVCMQSEATYNYSAAIRKARNIVKDIGEHVKHRN